MIRLFLSNLIWRWHEWQDRQADTEHGFSLYGTTQTDRAELNGRCGVDGDTHAVGAMFDTAPEAVVLPSIAEGAASASASWVRTGHLPLSK